MDKFTIETLPPMKLPLVTRLYKAHYPAGKAKKDELTIVGYLNSSIVAVVRFRTIEEYRLLTGMLVIPEHQGYGLGHQLLKHCHSYELREGDFCFSYKHLISLYQQFDFHTVSNSELPNTLQALFTRYTRSGKALIPMQYKGYRK
ncbi:GNAT family N-acetyltransferase [Vibrio ostreicida]|uniref:GNAT family N-acetyltransferase n=1 Tax=Vibrio ostreicida TaxID=526588 RepID=UPI003B5A55AC